jgi:hypothetical protein
VAHCHPAHVPPEDGMRSDEGTVPGVYHSNVQEGNTNEEQATLCVEGSVVAASLKEREVRYRDQEYSQTWGSSRLTIVIIIRVPLHPARQPGGARPTMWPKLNKISQLLDSQHRIVFNTKQ